MTNCHCLRGPFIMSLRCTAWCIFGRWLVARVIEAALLTCSFARGLAGRYSQSGLTWLETCVNSQHTVLLS